MLENASWWSRAAGGDGAKRDGTGQAGHPKLVLVSTPDEKVVAQLYKSGIAYFQPLHPRMDHCSRVG